MTPEYAAFLSSKAVRAKERGLVVVSLKQGRKFIGIELKESYWRQAVRYLDAEDRQGNLLAQIA